MVKIMGWEIRRSRAGDNVGRCEFCHRWGIPLATRTTGALQTTHVCSKCAADWEVQHRLDVQYWRTHPDCVPVCLNCGKAVPVEQLTPAVCMDWYFCGECASNSTVRRHYEILREYKRR
jgi:hypothetical protein